MGEILLARVVGPGGFEKLVVIKRVLPEYAGSEDFTEMLLDEARIAAQLNHPNICQVHDVGMMDGYYFMAMEYLEGVSVAEVLQTCHKERRLPDPRLALTVLQQACLGLDYAHDFVDLDGRHLGLVHRDISPSNLFITTNGNVKVLDFGVAKSQSRSSKTETGRIKGKYSYMSPEQIMGHTVDRRSDVFSLGIVFFELLAGARLFPSKNEFMVFKSIVEEELPSIYQYRDDISPELVAVLERALARSKDARFQSAGEFALALQEASSSIGGFLPTASLQEQLHGNFGKQIREQRRRIELARQKEVPSVDLQLDSLAYREMTTQPNVGRHDVADDTPTVAERSDHFEAPEHTIEDAPSTRAQAVEGRSRPWWRSVAGIVVLVLVPAAVTAGVFLLLNRQSDASEASPQQVVVYQTPAASPGSSTPAVEGKDDSIGATETPADTKNEPVPPKKPKKRAGRYGVVFHKRRAALKRCLENMDSATGSPTIAIEMQINTSGGVNSAAIKPATLEQTELGRCILNIVKDMNFGKHTEPVQVSVPLEIRVR